MSKEPAQDEISSSVSVHPVFGDQTKGGKFFNRFNSNLYPGQSFILFLVSVAAIFLLVLIFVDVRPFFNNSDVPDAQFVEYKVGDVSTVEQNVSQYRALSEEEKRVIVSDFEKNWNEAQDDYARYGAYRIMYSSLHARYNVTKDPQILEQMESVESFMSAVPEWKEFYDATKADGGFIE